MIFINRIIHVFFSFAVAESESNALDSFRSTIITEKIEFEKQSKQEIGSWCRVWNVILGGRNATVRCVRASLAQHTDATQETKLSPPSASCEFVALCQLPGGRRAQPWAYESERMRTRALIQLKQVLKLLILVLKYHPQIFFATYVWHIFVILSRSTFMWCNFGASLS